MSRPGCTPPTSAPAQSVSYRQLLARCPGLRNLWLGKLVSFAGDWFNAVAILSAVQALSSSAQALTLVMLARTLAVCVIAPIAGPLIDRFDRRRILLCVDALRALGALGLLAAYQFESLVGLYAGLVAMMFCAGVAVPTQHALVPQLIKRAHVPMANGLLAATWAIMATLGAALGGVVTDQFGISAALLGDALTFVISLGFFARMPALPAVARAAADSASDQAVGFVACLVHVARRPYVLLLTVLKPMLQLLGGLMAFLPLFAAGAFSGASGSLYLGILFAARGLGAAVGATYLQRLIGNHAGTMRVGMIFSYGLIALSYAALAMAQTFWQAAAAIFAVGVGHSLGWVASTGLLQMESDPRFHGRLFSLEFCLSMLLMAGSGLVAGAALDSGISLRAVTAGFAALAALPLVLWLVVSPGRGRTSSGHESDRRRPAAARFRAAVVALLTAAGKGRRHS